MELSNNPVPSYYMSDLQFSRLYALVYLDEQLRAHPQHGAMYCQYMEDRIAELLDWSDAKLLDILAKALGGDQAFLAFKNSIPNSAMFSERYCEHARALVPAQTIKDAVEENQFWAATNSIVYILTIHGFVAQLKNDHGVVLLKNHFHDPDMQAAMMKNIVLNMMFIKPLQIDPVPSVLDGYSFNTLDDIINNKNNRAITLPSNATCC